MAAATSGTLSTTALARPVVASAPVIHADDVIIVSGGARGVTASCLIEWGQRAPAHFVLLGRTPLDAESPACAGIYTEADLKRALLAVCSRFKHNRTVTDCYGGIFGLNLARCYFGLGVLTKLLLIKRNKYGLVFCEPLHNSTKRHNPLPPWICFYVL